MERDAPVNAVERCPDLEKYIIREGGISRSRPRQTPSFEPLFRVYIHKYSLIRTFLGILCIFCKNLGSIFWGTWVLGSRGVTHGEVYLQGSDDKTKEPHEASISSAWPIEYGAPNIGSATMCGAT